MRSSSRSSSAPQPPPEDYSTLYMFFAVVVAVIAAIGYMFFGPAAAGPVIADFSDPSNPVVFFDIDIGGKDYGRIEMEVFANVVPKTAENFRVLATGELGNKNGIEMHYEGSPFHRVIPNFMLQGGDFTRGDGMGGTSIYGSQFFDDENFVLMHNEKYLLSMANSGKNTNGGQFFITTANTRHLDGKHVVFGRVTKGHHVVDRIESFGTSPSGKTRKPVRIKKSGQLS